MGGRPTELAFAPRGNLVYVANYLSDAIQVVDAESAKLVQTIPLGSPKTLSLERKGEIVFHDASHSLQPVVQLQHLPQRRTHRRHGLRHAQRRPAGPEHVPRSQPQEGPDPSPRDRDQAVDLARLADEPGRRRVRIVHQEHARPQAQGRRRQIADRLSWHARLSQEPISQSRRQLDGRSPARPRGLQVAQGRLQHLPRRP